MFLAYAGNMTVLTFINYKVVLIITGVGYCALGVGVAASTHFEEVGDSLRPTTSMKTRDRLRVAGRKWVVSVHLIQREVDVAMATVPLPPRIGTDFYHGILVVVGLSGISGRPVPNHQPSRCDRVAIGRPY